VPAAPLHQAGAGCGRSTRGQRAVGLAPSCKIVYVRFSGYQFITFLSLSLFAFFRSGQDQFLKVQNAACLLLPCIRPALGVCALPVGGVPLGLARKGLRQLVTQSGPLLRVPVHHLPPMFRLCARPSATFRCFRPSATFRCFRPSATQQRHLHVYTWGSTSAATYHLACYVALSPTTKP